MSTRDIAHRKERVEAVINLLTAGCIIALVTLILVAPI